MNEKQERFCREYVSDGDAVRAAAAAGYARPAQAAARLLARGDVRRAVSIDTAEGDAGSTVADHDEILAFFSAVMRGEAKDLLIVQNKRKRQYTAENGDKITDEETQLETFTVPVKLSDSINAANTLHKYYTGLGSEDDENVSGIVILPSIQTDETESEVKNES